MIVHKGVTFAVMLLAGMGVQSSFVASAMEQERSDTKIVTVIARAEAYSANLAIRSPAEQYNLTARFAAEAERQLRKSVFSSYLELSAEIEKHCDEARLAKVPARTERIRRISF